MQLHLCDFTTLDKKTLLKILSWRNHESVKAYMYNDQNIGEKEHFTFVQSLKTRNDKRYFLVRDDNEEIGVIDFNAISSHSALMGLYANPFLTQKGVGSKLMEAIIAYAFETLSVQVLQAEVFAHNKRAHQLYQKFGFKECSRTMIHTKEVIIMELTNENRIV